MPSSSTQKEHQPQQRRRRPQKRSSAHPKSSTPEVMKSFWPSNAVTYAGPDFMIDAPSPSSLPLPSSVMPRSRQQHQSQPEDVEPYLMDPVSEIQKKLCMMLKIQA